MCRGVQTGNNLLCTKVVASLKEHVKFVLKYGVGRKQRYLLSKSRQRSVTQVDDEDSVASVNTNAK